MEIYRFVLLMEIVILNIIHQLVDQEVNLINRLLTLIFIFLFLFIYIHFLPIKHYNIEGIINKKKE